MRQGLYPVIQLGTSFALIFSVFNSQSLIEITVLRKKAELDPDSGLTKDSGYYSLSIIYFFFTFSNIVVPSIVEKLGSKWSQIVGAMGYLFFMFTFFHINASFLYFSSAILGGAAALLWAGNGCYLVEVSQPTQLERNSGILWAMVQSSFIFGGLFLIYVFRSRDLFESLSLIYTVFTITTFLGIVILLFLPNSSLQSGIQSEDTENETESLLINNEDSEETRTGMKHSISKTLSVLKLSEMRCLVVLFIYSGLEMTFFTGVYTSCISATSAFAHFDLIIPYCALSIGTGQIAGALATGSIVKLTKLNYKKIIILASTGNLTAFVLAFLCLPYDSTMHSTETPTYISPSVPLVLIISFFLGLSDAFWQTQIYVAIGETFQNNLVYAFAIFKFFQSLSASVAFFYSSLVWLPGQLIILFCFCVLSTYSLVNFKKNKLSVIDSVTVVRNRL